MTISLVWLQPLRIDQYHIRLLLMRKYILYLEIWSIWSCVIPSSMLKYSCDYYFEKTFPLYFVFSSFFLFILTPLTIEKNACSNYKRELLTISNIQILGCYINGKGNSNMLKDRYGFHFISPKGNRKEYGYQWWAELFLLRFCFSFDSLLFLYDCDFKDTFHEAANCRPNIRN